MCYVLNFVLCFYFMLCYVIVLFLYYFLNITVTLCVQNAAVFYIIFVVLYYVVNVPTLSLQNVKCYMMLLGVVL